jgi:hypothetical protein
VHATVLTVVNLRILLGVGDSSPLRISGVVRMKQRVTAFAFCKGLLAETASVAIQELA